MKPGVSDRASWGLQWLHPRIVMATNRAIAVCLGTALLFGAWVNLSANAATLEEIFALPFASQLTAAPAGHVAWLSEESGIRNVWIASPRGYEARPLSAYEADDGEEIRQLVFSSDGGTLFFVRGSPSNPLSKPEPEEQAVWSVLIDGGSPRRIAEGNSPAASPAGDRLAFLRRAEAAGDCLLFSPRFRFTRDKKNAITGFLLSRTPEGPKNLRFNKL